MNKRACLTIFLLTTLIGVVRVMPSWAQVGPETRNPVKYRVELLNDLNPVLDGGYASAITESDIAVGSAIVDLPSDSSAVLWNVSPVNQPFSVRTVLPPTYSEFTDINEYLNVVGNSGRGTILAPATPFYLSPSLGIIPLPLLSGAVFGGKALAINNQGRIAGYSYSSNRLFNAVVWNGANIRQLPNSPPWTSGYAFDINDHNVAVGKLCDSLTSMCTPTKWISPDQPAQLLPCFSSSNDGEVTAINNNNIAVGICGTDAGIAVLWGHQGTTVIPMGGLVTNGRAWPKSVNNQDLVVGAAETPSGNRAFIYFPWHHSLYPRKMVDLNTLIVPNSGWILLEATDINDNGIIVGHGLLNGVQQAYKLVPAT